MKRPSENLIGVPVQREKTVQGLGEAFLSEGRGSHQGEGSRKNERERWNGGGWAGKVHSKRPTERGST